MGKQVEEWVLESGTWTRSAGTPTWTPTKLADARAFPDRLSAIERLALIRTCSGSAPADELPARFPVDFTYSPETGERLTRPSVAPSVAWAPPHGAPIRRAGAPQLPDIRGLRQTTHSLEISRTASNRPGARRTPQDDADRTIPAPPPGHYEFAVGRFGAELDTLLAIEPEKGSLYIWLTAGKRWAPLNHKGGGTLAESSLAPAHWSAEFVQEADGAGETLLFLPTVSGLAVVRPDAITMDFSVEYIGDGAVLGAPILWGGSVWAPMRDAVGAIALFATSTKGKLAKTHATTLEPHAQTLSAPVCDARRITWASTAGQLVVTKSTDGLPQANWIEWPPGIQPVFTLGSAYLSATGQFWLPCWSEPSEAYVYVQLGRPAPEIMPTNAPALCTGRRSYKMGTVMLGDPWDDPQDASHGSSSEVVMPLLESTLHGAVLGLAVRAEDGVTGLLESNERHASVLQLRTDGDSDERFHTLMVSKPWRTRAFIFDCVLWAYHPDLKSIVGTELKT